MLDTAHKSFFKSSLPSVIRPSSVCVGFPQNGTLYSVVSIKYSAADEFSGFKGGCLGPAASSLSVGCLCFALLPSACSGSVKGHGLVTQIICVELLCDCFFLFSLNFSISPTDLSHFKLGPFVLLLQSYATLVFCRG